MQFAASIGLPRKVTKPKADHHERMAEHWCEMARRCGRPGYHEARGFADDRRRLGDGKWEPRRRSIAGCEEPYGPFSRSHWKYIRLAMREAFLAEWHRALGTTYETTEGGRRSMSVLTGITS
jgi:hypothetical protein